MSAWTKLANFGSGLEADLAVEQLRGQNIVLKEQSRHEGAEPRRPHQREDIRAAVRAQPTACRDEPPQHSAGAECQREKRRERGAALSCVVVHRAFVGGWGRR